MPTGPSAALYLPQHPVYAIQFDAPLAERYRIYLLSETYDLWEVRWLEE
jgi:hypothetical protein